MAWSAEQQQNAAIIARVGQGLGASPRDIQVAIMAAIVESGLRNLNYGDADSVGMFQQRTAWGNAADREDPYKSAKMFFTGGAGGQRGLLDFKNRGSMGMGEAAQAVQVSAFPDRYAAQQQAAAHLMKGLGDFPVPSPDPSTGVSIPTPADSLAHISGINALSDLSKTLTPTDSGPLTVDALGDTTNAPGVATPTGIDTQSVSAAPSSGLGTAEQGNLPTPGALPTSEQTTKLHMPTLDQFNLPTHATDQYGVPTGENMSGWRGAVVKEARKYLGTPYVWGGTSPTGFDCSGLVQYVFQHAAGRSLPRLSSYQATAGQRVSFQHLQPGDLVAVDNSSRNAGADHIGIYIGHGHVIEAPHPGGHVEVGTLGDFSGGWGVSFG